MRPPGGSKSKLKHSAGGPPGKANHPPIRRGLAQQELTQRMQMLARFLRDAGRGSRAEQLPTTVNVPGNQEAAAPLQLTRDRQGKDKRATLTQVS